MPKLENWHLSACLLSYALFLGASVWYYRCVKKFRRRQAAAWRRFADRALAWFYRDQFFRGVFDRD